MKIEANIKTEIEVKFVRVEIAVRYEEEDIPNDFPLRVNDMWCATIDIDTGKIVNWPTGSKGGKLSMKVCDEGSYFIDDPQGKQLGSVEQNYVPHGVIPGTYGDYVDLQINDEGVITNWPKDPDVSAFFPED